MYSVLMRVGSSFDIKMALCHKRKDSFCSFTFQAESEEGQIDEFSTISVIPKTFWIQALMNTCFIIVYVHLNNLLNYVS